MDDERRLTIVKEIKYWKETRLLPEHYCDYLLALYTEGEDLEGISTEPKALEPTFPSKGVERFQLVLLYLLLPFSIVALYFTEINLYLQLIILVLLLSYSSWCAFYFKERGKLHYHSSIIISLFLFLLLTILVIDIFFQSSTLKIIGISTHFLIWILLGIYNKLFYLIIAGVFGIGFALIYYFI